MIDFTSTAMLLLPIANLFSPNIQAEDLCHFIRPLPSQFAFTCDYSVNFPIEKTPIMTFDAGTLAPLEWNDEIYKIAAKEFDIDWRILSAIHLAERDRNIYPKPSPVGALGPMQFLPSSWFNFIGDLSGQREYVLVLEVNSRSNYSNARGYATDGNGDGIADINNYKDAMFSAANYIKSNKDVCGNYSCAIWQYNHAQWYVDKVLGNAYDIGFTN